MVVTPEVQDAPMMLEAPETAEPEPGLPDVPVADAAPIRFEDDSVAGLSDEEGGEELLLDQQIQPEPVSRSGSRWLASEPVAASNAAEPAAPAGATLFERMSNIARTSIKPEESGKTDPLDIPRFLNRQNNQ